MLVNSAMSFQALRKRQRGIARRPSHEFPFSWEGLSFSSVGFSLARRFREKVLRNRLREKVSQKGYEKMLREKTLEKRP